MTQQFSDYEAERTVFEIWRSGFISGATSALVTVEMEPERATRLAHKINDNAFRDPLNRSAVMDEINMIIIAAKRMQGHEPRHPH